MDNTSLFSVKEVENALVKQTLQEVYSSLKSKGYNPISQLVGYLITGDSGFITNFENARQKITKLERELVLENIVKEYIDKKV